jgi:hypothetical protein
MLTGIAHDCGLAECATYCLGGTPVTSPGVAWCGLTWVLAAAAGCGPARPCACVRWLPIEPGLSGKWLATIMLECSGPAAATGASRATGITWLSEAAFAADDGFDATPEACHAEPVVSQRANVWQAAAALPGPSRAAYPWCCRTGRAAGRPRWSAVPASTRPVSAPVRTVPITMAIIVLVCRTAVPPSLAPAAPAPSPADTMRHRAGRIPAGQRDLPRHWAVSCEPRGKYPSVYGGTALRSMWH